MRRLEAGSIDSDAILLLHGMGTGASAWQPQLDALSEEYFVLAPFLPGYGPNPGPFTMLSAREQIASMLDESTKSPAHVCGLSLGALVALDVAHSYPHLVRSLVLSAGFVALSEEHKAPRQASVDIIRNYDPAAFRKDVLPGLVRDVPKAHKDQALREIDGLTQADLAYLFSFEFDARDWVGEISVPTLVLCGDEDPVNLSLSRELAESLPQAAVEVIRGAGHIANLDAPRAFTTAIERFLSTVPD